MVDDQPIRRRRGEPVDGSRRRRRRRAKPKTDPLTLNPLKFPRLRFSDRSSLPEVEAVYFVYHAKPGQEKKPRCLYVGKARNLRSRFADHQKAPYFEDGDWIYYYTDFEWPHCSSEVEKRFIVKLNPSQNYDRGKIDLTLKFDRPTWNRLRRVGESDQELLNRMIKNTPNDFARS